MPDTERRYGQITDIRSANESPFKSVPKHLTLPERRKRRRFLSNNRIAAGMIAAGALTLGTLIARAHRSSEPLQIGIADVEQSIQLTEPPGFTLKTGGNKDNPERVPITLFDKEGAHARQAFIPPSVVIENATIHTRVDRADGQIRIEQRASFKCTEAQLGKNGIENAQKNPIPYTSESTCVVRSQFYTLPPYQ